MRYRLTYVASPLSAPAPAGYDGDFLWLPTGELLERRRNSELGSFSDIFRTIGTIAAGASGPIASVIPGVSTGAANIIAAVAQGTAAMFLVPKPPGGPAKGLAAIKAFCDKVLQALDQLAAAAANGQADRATVYSKADQLVALLSDPTAVYQAQRGDDADALNAAKQAAAQKAQQAKAAADAFAQGSPGGAGTQQPVTIDPATGQVIPATQTATGGADITTIAIVGIAGLALGWMFSS